MTSTDSVHRSVEIATDPGDTWELLVDDDERAAWFGGDTTLDPTPGGAGHFTDPDGTRRTAVVESVEPERRLSWTWWEDDDPTAPSRVDVALTPTPSGTRIDVVESPLVPTASASALTRPAGSLLDLEFRAILRTHALAPTCRR